LRNTGNRSRDKKENQKETDKQKEKRLHCEEIEGQEIDSFFLGQQELIQYLVFGTKDKREKIKNKKLL